MLQCDLPGAHELGINDLVFTPDGRYILTCSDDKTILIWDLSALSSSSDGSGSGGGGGGAQVKPMRTFRGHTSYVFCMAVAPGGNLLVSGGYDETVRVWDIKNTKVQRTLKAHSDPVSAVDFNRDGTLIVSSSYDGLCRVWETSSGRCLKTIYNEKTPPVYAHD